eukprot:CAMPEP_0172427282 /NCGR_PEP_ID=MMETSP1064-20121228/41454_1 /TAXON_ID=202472 /ORGANISM="Aulacoseira subarctica , Strain CCAP 1002/5" /LENGTH=33 /DNA_ID= /DNA_START= /DNA_END= /DNA_ORIENTATION=
MEEKGGIKALKVVRLKAMKGGSVVRFGVNKNAE